MNHELFEKGLAVRRAVAGEQAVEQALKNADEFSMPMQELVTEYCWGAISGRPGSTAAVAAFSTSACLPRSTAQRNSLATSVAPSIME